MKQSIPVGVIIAAVAVVLLIIGFFAFKTVAGDDGHGTISPTMAADYQKRQSTGYGQAPPGTTKPTGQGYGGYRPGMSGQGQGQGYGGYRPGSMSGAPGGMSGGQGR